MKHLPRLMLAIMIGLVGISVPPASSAAAATTYHVSIVEPSNDYTTWTYQPDTLTIHIGDTVVWTNMGGASHTVTAKDGSFNSANVSPGQSFSKTFLGASTFTYYCEYHPWMKGTLIVLGAGQTATPATATPHPPTSTPVPPTPTVARHVATATPVPPSATPPSITPTAIPATTTTAAPSATTASIPPSSTPAPSASPTPVVAPAPSGHSGPGNGVWIGLGLVALLILAGAAILLWRRRSI